MDDAQGGGTRGSGAEELILRTVAAHAESLLRTARRFSICPDDAQDAYQRALEIFMVHAERLDAAHAAGWLHVVVKREAQAIRKSRQKLVASDDVDMDAHEARSLPTPEERLATFDLIGRSAEALQRLKPQELRALWLRAQGHSYNDIGAMTGWSYTKVNRCLTEGRRSFLKRYANIESGAECQQWLPTISAMVDGEATPEQVVQLRPHLRNCPGCRATLRALQDSAEPLAAILPIPLVAISATADAGDHVSNVLMRLYEMVAGGIHDRAATSVLKAQAIIETSAAGKAAAIAGAAAAVAGGGYATVERTAGVRQAERPVKVQRAINRVESRAQQRDPPAVLTRPGVARRRIVHDRSQPTRSPRQPRTEFRSVSRQNDPPRAPEFEAPYQRLGGASNSAIRARTAARAVHETTPPEPAPEFARPAAPAPAPEFGP